jgi:TRAP-type C4-dicarboxylate transport system substrate-binding protein
MSLKITRRQFGKGAIASAAIVSSVGLSNPVQAKVTIRHANAANAAYTGNKFADAYFARVKELSGGEIQAETFFGTLGGEKTLVDGVALGTLDGANVAYTGTREFDIFYAAQMFRDYDHASRVVNGPLRPQLDKLMNDKYNAHLLGIGRAGAFGLYLNTKVDSWSGIRNMNIRSGQIEGVLAGLRAFGANPTPIPFNEVYTALQQGVAEGQVTLSSLVISQKFYEVTKYAIRQDFGHGLDKFVLSNRIWNQLTSSQKEMMTETWIEMENTHWYTPVKNGAASDHRKWEEFNGAGTLLDLPLEEALAVMNPVNEKLVSEVFGAGSWKKIQDA